ncbi:MAG: MFS transporter [Pseudomonadota bacterium]
MNLFLKNTLHPIGRGMPAEDRTAALVALMIGIFATSIETSIANTALPTIARELGVSEAASTWVASSYQLAMVAVLLPAAALGEVVGHRRVFLGGLLAFGLASLFCGLSTSLPALVFWRFVQGMGAAGVMGISGALVRVIYPASALGRGMGTNALVVGLAFAGGPSVASAVLSVASWQWLFLFNVPLCGVAIWAGRRSLPLTATSPHGFDGVAAVLCAALLGTTVYTLTEAAHFADGLQVVGCAVLAVVLLVLLLRRQAGHQAPILAIDLLRGRIFSLAAVTAICSFAAQALAFVSLPFMLQTVLGYSQVETGFLITPWPLMVALMAPVAGRLSDRVRPAVLVGLGMATMSIGLCLLALLPAQATPADILWRLAVCGTGFGLFQSPNLRTLMGGAPPARSGSASGMIATFRLLGQSSGVALVAACFHVSSVQGATYALWLGAAFTALAVGITVVRLRA